MPPGGRLPTIRQLAADLGLAKGTIERAYELLENDAVVERRGRNGTFVAEVTPATTQEMIRDLETSAESLVITARQLGGDEEAAVRALRTVWQRL